MDADPDPVGVAGAHGACRERSDRELGHRLLGFAFEEPEYDGAIVRTSAAQGGGESWGRGHWFESSTAQFRLV
jgi:hypothetical protein